MIALVPVGEVRPSEIVFLRPVLEEAFGRDVVLGSALPVPDDAYDPTRGLRQVLIENIGEQFAPVPAATVRPEPAERLKAFGPAAERWEVSERAPAEVGPRSPRFRSPPHRPPDPPE